MTKAPQPGRSKTGADAPDLATILRDNMAQFSPAEQNLAAYMLDNLPILPFETGVSIARTVGVSEMTVTRFVRNLGFRSLRDLKRHLRDGLSDRDTRIDDHLERFQMHRGDTGALQESLRLELDAVVSAYSLTTTRPWADAVGLIADAGAVHVVGFQASTGLAMDFAHRLLWTRAGVSFVPNTSGTFGEILTADPERTVVVLVDTALYANHAIRLSQRLKEIGMPLVIVTDKFSHWGYAYSHLVFEGRTHIRTFWDSTASLSVILNLMIDGVARRLGPKAREHFARLAESGRYFGEFTQDHGSADKGWYASRPGKEDE